MWHLYNFGRVEPAEVIFTDWFGVLHEQLQHLHLVILVFVFFYPITHEPQATDG